MVSEKSLTDRFLLLGHQRVGKCPPGHWSFRLVLQPMLMRNPIAFGPVIRSQWHYCQDTFFSFNEPFLSHCKRRYNYTSHQSSFNTTLVEATSDGVEAIVEVTFNVALSPVFARTSSWKSMEHENDNPSLESLSWGKPPRPRARFVEVNGPWGTMLLRWVSFLEGNPPDPRCSLRSKFLCLPMTAASSSFYLRHTPSHTKEVRATRARRGRKVGIRRPEHCGIFT